MKSKRWKRRNRHSRPEWVNAYDLTVWFNQEFSDYTSIPKPFYVPGLNEKGKLRFMLTNTTPQHHQR